MKLSKDSADAPDVNTAVVLVADNHFRSPANTEEERWKRRKVSSSAVLVTSQLQSLRTAFSVPVRAALYVGGEVVGGEAAAAEVDQLHLTPRVALDDDVLRLHRVTTKKTRCKFGVNAMTLG